MNPHLQGDFFICLSCEQANLELQFGVAEKRPRLLALMSRTRQTISAGKKAVGSNMECNGVLCAADGFNVANYLTFQMAHYSPFLVSSPAWLEILCVSDPLEWTNGRRLFQHKVSVI